MSSSWCRLSSLLFSCFFFLLLLLMTALLGLVVVNDFFFVFLLGLELNADFFFTSPAALYFECWLDTELANTDKERSVVAKGGAIIVINSIQS
jgi:hypothetical protein